MYANGMEFVLTIQISGAKYMISYTYGSFWKQRSQKIIRQDSGGVCENPDYRF